MGFADRDYYRQPAGRSSGGVVFGQSFSALSVTTWLIIINVVVFLVDRVVHQQVVYYDNWGTYEPVTIHPITAFGEFTATAAIAHLQVWRFITFQFLHAGPDHLLFNMFALFFFGPLIERYLGRIRYLIFYLLCGIAGPICLLVMAALHVLAVAPNTPLVGASAGIFGILIAAAMVLPDATVLVYGVFPAKLRTVAWVLLAVAVYTVISNGENAGGESAHIGGAAAGFLLIKYPVVLGSLERLWRKR
ncbi:MAG: rhomboid family intramembrane serine protease [Phycisphaerae bacterium]|nr:rhomboid family intramembrane serine protease [Phycisphaerae bacterium]